MDYTIDHQKIMMILEGISFDKDLRKTINYLYHRWQDEKKYEDWQDYSNIIKDKLKKHNIEFEKATKRPFGAKFKIGNHRFQLKIIFKGDYYAVPIEEI